MDNKSLREQFEISGFFYEKNGYHFRKYLNIRKNGTDKKAPDLMVIMMNPGSSKPTNRNLNGRTETSTDPDNTQNQIMIVMLTCNFEYARILNLSDLSDSQSSSFYSKLKYLNKAQINHSIFQDERKSDFEHLFIRNAKLIVAWGVNKALKKLAETALINIGENKIGWNKAGISWAFYHPLPRNDQKQKEWVSEILNQIKNDGF